MTIALDPARVNRVNNHTRRGALQLRIGEFAAARADFDQALKLDSSLARAYSHRGLVHDSEGDADRALADRRRSVELDGKDQDAQAALARLERAATHVPGRGTMNRPPDRDV